MMIVSMLSLIFFEVYFYVLLKVMFHKEIYTISHLIGLLNLKVKCKHYL